MPYLETLPDVCYDLDGNGVDAAGLAPTATGGVYSAGLIGQALNGGETASVFADPVVDLSGNMTLCFWIQTRTGGNLQVGFSKTGVGIYYVAVTVTCSAGSITGIYFLSNTTLVSHTIDGWEHVAIVRTGTTVELFLGGVSVATFTEALDSSAVLDFVSIAAVGGVPGQIDQVLAFERAISDEEVAFLAANPMAFSAMRAGPSSYHSRHRRLILDAAADDDNGGIVS
jgi:hypothetical protein